MPVSLSKYRGALLLIAVVAIAGVIFYLESQRSRGGPPGAPSSDGDIVTRLVQDKESQYDRAVELIGAGGWINAEPFKLADHIGQKVILVDFWTYSCINCQRTLPYLNQWWKEYGDDGLLIVGVHTPEFAFEGDIGNVRRAVGKYGVEYPVVLDNDYATWRAYGNRYWPRKYLIDIDGYIVYDHIGEGGYEETELVIQRLLAERATRLAAARPEFPGTAQLAGAEEIEDGMRRTPEIYFGSSRNSRLGNGQSEMAGTAAFEVPPSRGEDLYYLGGTWRIEPEYAETAEVGARIVLPYRAQKVFMVAEGVDGAAVVEVLLDGQPVGDLAGAHVVDGRVSVTAADLYRLVEDREYGEHTLELVVKGGTVRAFTFTFG
jgi:thiol-disulfide isomerase/thioredoxin